MGVNQYKRGKFTWGASFSKTLTFEFRPDLAISYPRALEGSQWATTIAGTRDAWVIDEYVLEFDCRYVYTTHSTYSPWDGSNGLAQWLMWARKQNPVRWFPDATSGTYIESYLANVDTIPTLEVDSSRALHLMLVNMTTPYDNY